MWTRCFLSDLYGGLSSGELHREMDGGQHVFTDIMERIAKRRVKKNLENFNNLKNLQVLKIATMFPVVCRLLHIHSNKIAFLFLEIRCLQNEEN